MAVFDLKSALDLIYKETKRRGIYIGYSMGTTISIIYNIKEQKTAEKTLRNIIHLAPITKMEHSKSLLKYLNPFWPLARPVASRIWDGELFPRVEKKRINFCSPYPFQKRICEVLLWPIFGRNVFQLNPLDFPVTSRQNSDSVSIGTIDHYSQIIRAKKFEEYNHGFAGNLKKYHRMKPPLYNMDKLSIPQTIFVGERDILSTQKDARNFYDNLPGKLKCGFYVVEKYSHRDFMRAENLQEYVFNDILRIISEMESGKC